MSEFLDNMAEVFSAAGLLTTIVAGILGGIFLTAFQRYSAKVRPAVFWAWIIGWLGLLYYVGRIVEAAWRDDPDTGRIIASAVLWLIFAAVVGLSMWATAQVQEDWKRHRDPKNGDGQHE